jgi:hypothetical protein
MIQAQAMKRVQVHHATTSASHFLLPRPIISNALEPVNKLLELIQQGEEIWLYFAESK